MFERFTDRARRAVVLAQDEARRLNHDYIGAEHILLGLIHEGNGVAARALQSLGITEGAVRQQVEEIASPSRQPRTGHIPFTRQAKKVLELSLREAIHLGHNYIGTEHILLGIIREGGNPAAEVLTRLGADLNTVRGQVVELLERLGGNEPGSGQPAERSGKETGGPGRRRMLSQVLHRFDSIEARLSAVEQRVGTGPDVRDLEQEIRRVRREKESAVERQDFENAAALRDREKELADEKESRREQWAAAHLDLPSLSDEVERLRDLLRRHGIDPQDGVA